MSQPTIPWRADQRGRRSITMRELQAALRAETQPITGQPQPEPEPTGDSPGLERAETLADLFDYYQRRTGDPVAAAHMVTAHVLSVGVFDREA
jgi:hypothetical protein